MLSRCIVWCSSVWLVLFKTWVSQKSSTRWWFQIFFIFTPLTNIFQMGGSTTNQSKITEKPSETVGVVRLTLPCFEVVMVSRDFMCELTKTEEVHNSRPIYSNEETPFGAQVCGINLWNPSPWPKYGGMNWLWSLEPNGCFYFDLQLSPAKKLARRYG